jgi:hypothetical protein
MVLLDYTWFLYVGGVRRLDECFAFRPVKWLDLQGGILSLYMQGLFLPCTDPEEISLF